MIYSHVSHSLDGIIMLYSLNVIKISILQLDEHFSRPMKEFVSLCLKKVPAEVSNYAFAYPSNCLGYLVLP